VADGDLKEVGANGAGKGRAGGEARGRGEGGVVASAGARVDEDGDDIGEAAHLASGEIFQAGIEVLVGMEEAGHEFEGVADFLRGGIATDSQLFVMVQCDTRADANYVEPATWKRQAARLVERPATAVNRRLEAAVHYAIF
jgi:hypothetical protein